MPTFSIFNNEPDVRSFLAGQAIFVEGQPDNDLMYAVLDGEVEIVQQQRLLETIPPGGCSVKWRCWMINRIAPQRSLKRTAG